MSREAKSLRCLSMTTLRGGFPGIGSNGSITYTQNGRVNSQISIMAGRCFTYLWVDISDTWALLGVMALVDLVVSVPVLANNDIGWGGSISDCGGGGSSRCFGAWVLPFDAYSEGEQG